jgi:hypothetical protein
LFRCKHVYGIPANYLEKWDVLDIEEVEDVDIVAHRCPISGHVVACEIGFDDSEWLDLRPRYTKPNEIETEAGARQGRLQ